MSVAASEIRAPSLGLQLLETRAVGELYAYMASYPLLPMVPKGDGHPVLVLPGFLASGTSTFPLRHFLKRLEYKGHRWKLGRNLGPVGEKEKDILVRLRELRERYDQKVSLIGWSLGGVYARELAWMAPDDVRMVITLGSPLRHHGSTAVSDLYRAISGQDESSAEDIDLERVASPPPVPATAIYSRSDGVVPWRCSLERESPTTENIRVYSSHIGLGHNPAVLWAIADRLAQAEGQWKPFDRTLCRQVMYPEPDVCDG